MKKLKVCLIVSACLNVILLALLMQSRWEKMPKVWLDGTTIHGSTDWGTIESVFQSIPFEITRVGIRHDGWTSISLSRDVILWAHQHRAGGVSALIRACPNKNICLAME